MKIMRGLGFWPGDLSVVGRIYGGLYGRSLVAPDAAGRIALSGRWSRSWSIELPLLAIVGA